MSLTEPYKNNEWTLDESISENNSFSKDTGPGDEGLGVKIREIRNQRGWTLRMLEDKSKIDINTLSLIENGKSSPSIYILQRLAKALDVPIVTFFESVEPSKPIVFTAHDQRPQAACCHTHIQYLGKGLKNFTLEPFVIIIEKDATSGERTLVHGGNEFVYCLSGKILYIVQEQEYLLSAGDSILFSAQLGHRWKNIHDGESQLMMVLTPAGQYQEQSPSHFFNGEEELKVTQD